MPEKILKSMKDDNPELQKQIGCINGFLQLFDRQRFLTSRRSSQSPKRLAPPGKSNEQTKELNSKLQKSTEKNLKAVKEKHGFSTESSITSFSSSSCSSSLSSLEYNKTIHVDPPSSSQTDFPETPRGNLGIKRANTSNLPFDLRNAVKDSLHREARTILVKTANKEELVGHALKYIDSPRPLEPPKSVKTEAQSLNESFRVLAQLQEAPWNSSKGKDHYLFLAPKDRPRLSYDGRYSRDTFRSTVKLKELPRLSLDSREGSMKGVNNEPKSGNFLKDPQKGNGNSSVMLKQLQEPETSRRSSSIVAKLMGLEALSDLTPTSENTLGTSTAYATDKIDLLERSLKTTDENKHQSSGSPRNSRKECTSSQVRSSNLVRKSTPSSKFPIEAAPWKQPDASRSSQLSASKCREAPTKTSNSSLSVYGEIEKRLAKLEFKKSGKDLRALKQILDAMQKSKDSVDITRDQTSNSVSNVTNKSVLNESSDEASPRNQQSKDHQISCLVKRSDSSHKLPIVIMKPAKHTRKTSNPACPETSTDSTSILCNPGASYNGRSVDKQTEKGFTRTLNPVRRPTSQALCSSNKHANMRISKSIQSSKVLPQNMNAENTMISGITGADSPRLGHKKFGLAKLSRPASSSSDSSRNRRQYGRHPIETSTSSRTPRQTSLNLQESKDRSSEISCGTTMTGTNHHDDAVSLQFECKRSLDSQSDKEVININQSAEELGEKGATEEIVVATPEQPSPVSVLDATFYRDDPPSPVKKKPHSLTDNEVPDPDTVEQNTVELSRLYNTMKSSCSTDNDDRLNNTRHLVKTLQQINWTYEEPNTTLAPAFDRKNPDHKYILELLSASGLLRDPDSGQTIHSSIQPINPNLFVAVEQITGFKGLSNNGDSIKKISEIATVEQMQRKLIFDVVNNILVQKLVSENLSRQWLSPNKLAGRISGGQHLLSELCSETDQLQCNKIGSEDDKDDNLRSILFGDLFHHPLHWTRYHSEIPEVALDVERLIFKDLITEIVCGEAASLPGRHCRKLLFPK
ncbi:Protein LONGIFOLIA [Quillaja saponaria]|uniref:Protein LONGIFOLIA n=1 Tax=Quillaja saponaria TaxID=32244 RepID=A0AAD7Q3N1_QUISA|nr:Protein LONGIFOLIA [Quillaja saponaria]